MKVLLKSVQIIEQLNRSNRVNVFISDGIITNIDERSFEADITIESESLLVSPGWVDLGAFVADPGFEYKEDLHSSIIGAASGGFTEVACLPNTAPSIQDKNAISYYVSGNKYRVVNLLPLGSVTLNNFGTELTEMIDLHNAGAVGFTDGFKSLNNSDIILKSLLYLSKINSLLINKPNDISLSIGGVAHEGINSTMLGLKGMPALAEEIAIIRDLKLLEYAGGKIHFSNISTAGSIDLIREAKKKGLNVTCDIAAHQVAFDDSVLKGFDTNFKVNPPLRTVDDIQEIWRGLEDGTIDAISSAHSPQDEESKKLEFDLAEFGVIGFETAFSIINTLNTKLSIEEIVNKICYKPREILNLPIPQIRVGEKANLTVFDPTLNWVYKEENIKSKSKNTPFIGYNFTGKPLAVFNNGNSYISEFLTTLHQQ